MRNVTRFLRRYGREGKIRKNTGKYAAKGNNEEACILENSRRVDWFSIEFFLSFIYLFIYLILYYFTISSASSLPDKFLASLIDIATINTTFHCSFYI